MVKPSRRQELAQKAVQDKAIPITFACALFGLCESCYRYQAKLSDENAAIADWLQRLTSTNRSWGFGLCYYFLRNVKRYRWNHKRVYRSYRELGLNLRIKPKKRLSVINWMHWRCQRQSMNVGPWALCTTNWKMVAALGY